MSSEFVGGCLKYILILFLIQLALNPFFQFLMVIPIVIIFMISETIYFFLIRHKYVHFGVPDEIFEIFHKEFTYNLLQSYVFGFLISLLSYFFLSIIIFYSFDLSYLHEDFQFIEVLNLNFDSFFITIKKFFMLNFWNNWLLFLINLLIVVSIFIITTRIVFNSIKDNLPKKKIIEVPKLSFERYQNNFNKVLEIIGTNDEEKIEKYILYYDEKSQKMQNDNNLFEDFLELMKRNNINISKEELIFLSDNFYLYLDYQLWNKAISKLDAIRISTKSQKEFMSSIFNNKVKKEINNHFIYVYLFKTYGLQGLEIFENMLLEKKKESRLRKLEEKVNNTLVANKQQL